jgi:hypothetical protein
MTELPFDIEPGDGALIAKALREYRPETTEEEGALWFFIEQFEKLDIASAALTAASETGVGT